MFRAFRAFASFSVDDLAKAEAFYSGVLGLKVDSDRMGLTLHLPGGGTVFVYPKADHRPASFTVLNLEVDDIEEAVDELTRQGVRFERYQEGPVTDEKGIARGASKNLGPDIAWFKDPAANFFSVLETHRR